MSTSSRSRWLVPFLLVVPIGCGGPAGGDAADGAMTVSELLEERPDATVEVRGAIHAIGFEYFTPEGAGWEHDVSMCDELRIEPGDVADEVDCVGPSVWVSSELASLDLGWGFAGFESLYLERVVVHGRLDGDRLDVSHVVLDGTDVTIPGPTPATEPVTPATAAAPTAGEPPLPIEELDDEDLVGLRRYVRGTTPDYLPEHSFTRRVRQLRASCDADGRVQTIVDGVSGRGTPEATEVATDVVTQHWYVCPDVVAGLVVPDTLPSGFLDQLLVELDAN